MKQILIPTLVAIVVSGCATTSSQEPARMQAAAPDSKAALAGMKEMKMAFDIIDGNPTALLTKLTVIDLTRKQLIEAGVTPKIVLAFRGDASYYTQTNLSKVKEADRADALKIAAKLVPADLMQEVKLVGNGWISLVAYQQKGYGYIAP